MISRALPLGELLAICFLVFDNPDGSDRSRGRAPARSGLGSLARAGGARGARAADQPRHQPQGTPVTSPRPLPRLLVVEDDVSVRDVWRENLSALGYQVTAAEDGNAAMARFDAEAFDLVLTDLFMPGLDGWALAEAIWNRSPVPVILVTGSATDVDVERARAQGAVLLRKPVRLADVKRAIDTVLSGHLP